jgi:two-component system chemotaxis response regulator CheB
MLAEILSRTGTLNAKQAEDGETFENGIIYVAAPDRHLLLDGENRVRSVRGPRENRHRPAIDPLFRSAAVAYGSNVIGVVLSGTLDDGTAGLLAIKKRGGMAIVQDPTDAMYGAMPASALQHVGVDYKLRASEIASQLAMSLKEERSTIADDGDDEMRLESLTAGADRDALQEDDRPGQPSAFSCPECGGVLWEIDDGDLTRYRCRVGHAYSTDTMMVAQEDRIEEALWMAVKTLEESARISKRLAATERVRGHEWMAARFEQRESESRRRVDVLRRFLTRDLGELAAAQS